MNLLLQNISLPLSDFSLEVDVELQSQVTAIFGPSGAGKTSLLDLIAGLRRPASAFIQLDDRVLTSTAEKTRVPPRLRAMGYVPQDLALFPHLSVRQNLLYGQKSGRAPARCSASTTSPPFWKFSPWPAAASPICPAAKSSASPWPAPC